MKLFTPPKQAASGGASLKEIAARLDTLERVVAGLKHQAALLPAVLRKLYLSDVELPPPYDLQSMRFGYLSEHDADGLLLGLFSRIGMTDRRFVDIGCGGEGRNCGFFAQECGWRGLMVDALSANVEQVRVRYAGHDVTPVRQRVSPQGVDFLLTQFGFTGHLDLLNIDVGGMDYWLWEGVTACTPRVVVMEYNWLFGGDTAVTVPYRAPSDDPSPADTVRGYRGASLAALVALGRKKGYRLVATERVKAFFLLEDVAREIPAVSVEQGYRAPMNVVWANDALEAIKKAGLPLVNVTDASARA